MIKIVALVMMSISEGLIWLSVIWNLGEQKFQSSSLLRGFASKLELMISGHRLKLGRQKLMTF